MKSTLSTICQQAKIIDLENDIVHSFSALFEAAQATKKPHVTLGDITGHHTTAHSYLVCWGNALAAHTLTLKTPDQFKPDEIERLYERATALQPRKLAKGR